MLRSGRFVVLRMAFALAAATVALPVLATDDWDAAAIKDNTAGTTRNEPQRGVTQYHDLQAVGGVADEDWYVLPVSSQRAYQVFVGEVSGDTPIDNADFLELYDATGTTLIATATAAAGATGKVIRFFSGNASNFKVRVKGNTNSTATARYGFSWSEGTYYCPRYNQSGTQVSVLIVQNATNGNCGVAVDFYDEAANYLGTANPAAPLPWGGMWVLPVGSVAGLPGTKGSMRVHSFCSPSGLKIKAVALEPSTGFSFDTICERR
jgi:hypothetical protein